MSTAGWSTAQAIARPQEPAPKPGAGPAHRAVRPGRVVLTWAALASLAVAASTAYLSLQVYTALEWRSLQQLQRELQEERRRQQALEVQLARALAPAPTEQAAQQMLAMRRPQEVDLVVLDAASLALARAPGRPDGEPASGPAPGPAGGWQQAAAREIRQVGEALRGAVQAGAQARARPWTRWP